MKTPEDGKREKRFQEHVRSVRAKHFEQNAEEPDPEAVLKDVIELDRKLWDAMQPQLARDGALVVIKAIARKAPQIIDERQAALFPNMPKRIPFKSKNISFSKADAKALEWYEDWWKHRLEGLAKRTAEDLAIANEIEKSRRLLKKYDPTGTVESALRIRDERLAEARRKRDNRRSKGKK